MQLYDGNADNEGSRHQILHELSALLHEVLNTG